MSLGIKLHDDAIAALDSLPEHCRDGLRAYFEERRRVGDFLTAILANDLIGAAMRADGINKYCLFDYARWLYNFAPARSAGAWGSYEAVYNWPNKSNTEEESE